jgi:hypothetical protein
VTLSTYSTLSFRRVLKEQRQMHIESRHPLAAAAQRRRRQLADVSESGAESSQSKQRYLSFGSSVTWGIGLKEPTSQAYPYLLDGQAVSVALPTGNTYSDLAAACTQTLVGDDDWNTSPHVITVEYASTLTESHEILLQRLRRRFPAAVLVLVQLIPPATQMLLITVDSTSTSNSTGTTAGNYENDNATQTLQEWWSTQRSNTTLQVGVDPSSYESEWAPVELAHSMMQAAEQTSEGGGTRMWIVSPLAATVESRIVELLKADPLLLHYALPIPRDLTTDVEQLFEFLSLFSSDATVLSRQGHERVAHDVRTLVESSSLVRTTTAPNSSHGDIRTAAAAGSWGSGDDCHIWYATGNYNLESTGQPVNLPLEVEEGLLETGPHKHALEFTRKAPIGAGGDGTVNLLTIHNPFSTDRMLSLTYLTDADSMSYPKTRIVLNGVPTVLLYPFHDDSEMRHLARTSGVGYVPPGTSTVQLDPLQSTILPFRLLGASLLAEEVEELVSIEFALEPDSLAAATDDQMLRDRSSMTTGTGFLKSLFQ